MIKVNISNNRIKWFLAKNEKRIENNTANPKNCLRNLLWILKHAKPVKDDFNFSRYYYYAYRLNKCRKRLDKHQYAKAFYHIRYLAVSESILQERILYAMITILKN